MRRDDLVCPGEIAPAPSAGVAPARQHCLPAPRAAQETENMTAFLWALVVVGGAIAVASLVLTPDLLHPTSITVGKLSEWRLIGWGKRVVVKELYDFMASYGGVKVDWQCMNYGYGETDANDGVDPDMVSGLTTEQSSSVLAEPFNYQMYYALVRDGANGSLDSLNALEVGSGRGGGAAYVSRRFRPRHMHGIDISSQAVALAQALNKEDIDAGRLSYSIGDAEDMSSITSNSVDIVINVESQHCYASVDRFAAEVERILKPGGRFLFAGFTQASRYESLKRQLNGGNLHLLKQRNVTANVVRSLQLDEERKERLITELSPAWFLYFARGFAAMSGSTMRKAFEDGSTAYCFFVYQKDQCRTTQTSSVQ